jgi:hypothetical protein
MLPSQQLISINAVYGFLLLCDIVVSSCLNCEACCSEPGAPPQKSSVDHGNPFEKELDLEADIFD